MRMRGSWQKKVDHLFLVLALLTLPVPATADAWETFRGNPDNTGFANVTTLPARRAPVTIPNIGTFAAGAGPITGPDGTVYLGNEQGRVIALRADGTPYWNRQLPSGQAIVASAALGPSGTLYIVSVYKFTDHRVTPPQERARSTLWRFSPGGGDLGPMLFPTHGGENATVLAPPNILSFEGGEFVVVPAVYRLWDRVELRVIVFSAQGAVVADALAVTRLIDQDVTGSGLRWCLFFCVDFVHGTLSRTPPAPGVAIFRYAGGGDPWIVFSDSRHEVVGYTFRAGALTERYRVRQTGRDWRMRSAPVVLPEGRTLITFEEFEVQSGHDIGKMRGGVVFTGPAVPPPEIGSLGAIYGSPTRLADGRVLMVSYIPGDMVVLKDGQVIGRRAGPASFSAATASATHVFISTRDAFITLDAATLNEMAQIPWFGGGEQPPAIGPQGHVYALASNILFVFPAPRRREGEIEEPEGPIVR